MTDPRDIIIIRGGQVTVRRVDLAPAEAEALDEIAAKGDVPLCKAECFTLAVIVSRLARSP